MVHEVDVEVRIFLQDQAAIGLALVVERIVGHRGERGLQRAQPLHRGLRPRILLTVEREAAVLAMDRDQALGRSSRSRSHARHASALQPERVERPAAGCSPCVAIASAQTP